MIQMVDGPAAGLVFQVRRAPVWLRVARDRQTGQCDVLNFLDDQPTSGEDVFVYRKRPGTGGVVFVDGNHIRDRYQTGIYDFVAVTASQSEELRDKETWQAWVTEKAQAEGGG